MNYDKMKKTYFNLILISFLLTIVLIIMAFIFLSSLELQLLISSIILLFSFILLSVLRGRFEVAATLVSYRKLDTNRNPPIKIASTILTKDWFNTIKKKDYLLYKNFNDFDIYYKFAVLNNKSKRNKTMIVIVSIKNETKFNAKSLSKIINELGENFYKKERFNNHIVLQFKNVGEYTKDNIHEADQVLFKKQNNRNYIIIINVLQNINEKSIYFLHNDNYSPNRFYSYGINEILSLTK